MLLFTNHSSKFLPHSSCIFHIAFLKVTLALWKAFNLDLFLSMVWLYLETSRNEFGWKCISTHSFMNQIFNINYFLQCGPKDMKTSFLLRVSSKRPNRVLDPVQNCTFKILLLIWFEEEDMIYFHFILWTTASNCKSKDSLWYRGNDCLMSDIHVYQSFKRPTLSS